MGPGGCSFFFFFFSADLSFLLAQFAKQLVFWVDLMAHLLHSAAPSCPAVLLSRRGNMQQINITLVVIHFPPYRREHRGFACVAGVLICTKQKPQTKCKRGVALNVVNEINPKRKYWPFWVELQCSCTTGIPLAVWRTAVSCALTDLL